MWNIEMRLELNIPGELWNLRNGRIACFFRMLLGLVLSEVLCQPLTAHRWESAKRSCCCQFVLWGRALLSATGESTIVESTIGIFFELIGSPQRVASHRHRLGNEGQVHPFVPQGPCTDINGVKKRDELAKDWEVSAFL